MIDDSIEGLLKNLRQTLDIESKEKFAPKKEPEGTKESCSKGSSVFVLRKEDGNTATGQKDLLKESVLSHVESEVVRFVVDFCSSEDGMTYIKLLIVKALDAQEDFIKKILKEEISKKIQEVLASR